MSVIDSIFSVIGTWFGYVGSCVATPNATCTPFVSFIVLGAAATAGLALVVMAYHALQREETREIEERRAKARALATQERIRRRIATRAAVRAPARSVHTASHAPA
jgi:hypothetical protein